MVMLHLLRLILWISRNFEKFSESLFQRNEVLFEDDLKRMKLKTDFLFRLKDLNVAPNSVIIGGILFSHPSPSPTLASEPEELWPLEENEEISAGIRNVRILLKADLFREGASSSAISRMLMWGTAGDLAFAAKSFYFTNFYFSLRRTICFPAASTQQVRCFGVTFLQHILTIFRSESLTWGYLSTHRFSFQSATFLFFAFGILIVTYILLMIPSRFIYFSHPLKIEISLF